MADRKLNTAEAVNDIDSLLGVKGASIGRIAKKELLSVLLGGGEHCPTARMLTRTRS